MLEVLKPEELTNPPHLQVRPSPVHGQGLFTTKAFREGDIIGIVSGPLIDQAEAIRREREEANYYIYFLRDNVYIDASGGIGRWVNHACEPSVEVETRDESSLWIMAARDLAPGEEITLDYDDGQIYDFCRQRNPGCLQDQCPRLADGD